MGKEKPKEQTEELLVNVDDKLIPLSKLPCSKGCEWRYSLFCPRCEWNKDGRYNVY